MAASNSLPFVIPKRIHRSKTAILKALSNTVGVDKTAPHFAFIDDPTTIPTTVKDRRNFFLAQEFGRRAARQLAVEWPTLFMFDRDKPRLEAFRPEKLPALIDAERVDENSLRQLIDGKQVDGALRVFERLRADQAKISQDVVTDLFRLASYFNAQDPPPSENEEWPGIRNFYSDPKPDISKSNELINLLYSMVDPNVSNFSTLISWLCKYGDEQSTKRAFEMFNEANSKKWVLEEDAYIGLINQSSDIDSVDHILETVAQLKVRPSIRLFNAAIQSLSKVKDFDERYEAIRKYLGEISLLGLQPNLTTYHFVLSNLATTRENLDHLKLSVTCLNEIVEKLESQPSIQIQQFTDQKFFDTAMVITVLSNNGSLMDRVEQLYSSEKNQVKMSSFTIEAGFYSRYLIKKIRTTADTEEIDKLYTGLVPRIVGVTPDLIELMIQKLQGSNNWSLTKRVVEDGLCARHILNKEMMKKFLALLDEFQPSDENMSILERDDYEKLIVKIVDYLLEFANFEQGERLHQKMSPETLGYCVSLLLRTTQKPKAWNLINMLVRADEFAHQIDTDGYPNHQHLLEAFDLAISDGSLTNAGDCLKLIARYNPKFNLQPYLEKLTSTFQLGTTQKQDLLSFVKN